MATTLQRIFQHHFPSYPHKDVLSIAQAKAADAMMACCTDELGYEEWVCPKDGHIHKQSHSCRHRSCPQCNKAYTEQWLEKTQARLLPCGHFHVVFTLPHELNDIWQANRAWCADTLFKAAAETLQQLLADERYLGATPGILASLHTWGRTLSFHPHVHLLVTGGGMKDGGWVAAQKDFLLPVGVIKAKFRGKYLAWLRQAYAEGHIRLPKHWQERDWYKLLHKVSGKAWNICIKGAYRHGQGVTQYLARYVHGGPIKNHRLVHADGGKVGFRYHDYHEGKSKIMVLKTDDFLTRILWHVPVPGQHNLRYYGIYLPSVAKKRDTVRETLGNPVGETVPGKEKNEPACPVCGHALFHLRSTRRQISSIKNPASNIGGNLSNKPLKRTLAACAALADSAMINPSGFFVPVRDAA